MFGDTVTQIPIRRALISVYDKTGLEELASGLHAAGVEIVSTGSTAARIAAAGVPVTPVEELTGFPECLDGRVKTLHPPVHAGLLADTANSPRTQAQLAELGIEPFELLVSNLYPFEATVASGASPEQCVEQIDIGGPAMVRAAAKNHGSVAVVIDPSRYAGRAGRAGRGRVHPGPAPRAGRRGVRAHRRLRHRGGVLVRLRLRARRDRARGRLARSGRGALWRRADVLRYGENPHQRAALYTRPGAPTGIAAAEQLHGKAMSYNNYVDADAARRAAYDFAEPCVAIIKHSNPCGIAVGADLADAHAKANACDPVSAFGGVIAANGPVTAALARQIKDVFTEVVIAPGVRRRGPGHPVREQERPAAARAPARPPASARAAPGDRRHAAAVRRPGGRAGRRPGELAAQGRRAGRPRSARGPGVRVEGMPFGQIQCHPAGRRRRLGRGRDGPGQPGGFGPPGGAAGR